MKLLNVLVFSALMMSFIAQEARAQHPCKEIKAAAEVKHSTTQNDGSVIINIEGNASNFRIFLIAPKKENNRLDLPVEEIKNLPPGNYELVIAEAKEGEFCPKRIKVEIR